MDKKVEITKFIRFCIVGLFNTAVTFVVFTLLRWLSCGLYFSNIISYIAGVVNSFVWNKTWVYGSRNSKWLKEAFVFLILFGISYLIQLIVFKTSLNYVPEMLAQLIGMVVYSVTNFLLNRFFNFKNNGKN